MTLPTFETTRLIIKQISLEDVVCYEKYFIDYNVVEFLSASVPWPYPSGGIEHFLKTYVIPRLEKDRWYWGIFLKENLTELIGGVDLWLNGNPENRGFWLGYKFWGNGYMTEAIKPITDYAFDVIGFKKLIFSNAVNNKRSRRIKEKTGAKFIGTKPAKYVNPSYNKQELWELTKEDWQQFKKVGY